MKITVNGEEREFAAAMSVQELLRKCNIKMPEMVSVELNSTILKRDQYANQIVRDGDYVEFLYFMGGG